VNDVEKKKKFLDGAEYVVIGFVLYAIGYLIGAFL